MEHDELLMAILNYDCEGKYPPEFLADYDIMECLSEKNGIITFLVQDHSGESYIAKCYDRSLWNISDKSDLLAGLDHKGLPRQHQLYPWHLWRTESIPGDYCLRQRNQEPRRGLGEGTL